MDSALVAADLSIDIGQNISKATDSVAVAAGLASIAADAVRHFSEMQSLCDSGH